MPVFNCQPPQLVDQFALLFMEVERISVAGRQPGEPVGDGVEFGGEAGHAAMPIARRPQSSAGM